MTRRLGLGLVGLGGAAMQLLPSILADDRIVVTGVAETDPVSRRAFMADFDVPGYATIEELVAASDVEAVYIATPHEFHRAHAIAALGQGVHVLVEKPLALSVEDCLAIDTASRASGAQVVVGHTHAFDRPVRAVRDLIDGGAVGEVAMITSLNYGNFLYRPRRPEELDTRRGGGVIFNQVPHQVDIVRLIGGGVVRTVRSRAFVLDADRPTEGSHSTFLEFEGGASATLVYSGYDRFDTDELHGWVGENGEAGRPSHGEAVRALRGLDPGLDEASLKAARGYRQGWRPRAVDGSHHQPHFGFLLVSCSRADLRVGPDGIVVYDDSGAREVPLPGPGVYPDKSLVLDDLYRAAVLDHPSVHDAAWGAATLEVCHAILTSSRERREVTLAHQVPVVGSARVP